MKKITIGLIFFSIVVLSFLVGYLVKSNKKIGYVLSSEIFSEFKMTKEIDADIIKIEDKKQAILDSIADNIKKIQANVIKSDENNLNFLKKEFIAKRNQYADDLARIKQSNTEKIWKQINQYISDYGKEKGYDIILGANGQGSLMFGNDDINLTKEISSYINSKYAGVK